MMRTLTFTVILGFLIFLPLAAQALIQPLTPSTPVLLPSQAVSILPIDFLLERVAEVLNACLEGEELIENMLELPTRLLEHNPDLRLGDRLLDGPAMFIPMA